MSGHPLALAVLAVAAATLSAASPSPLLDAPVVVTGATGRTGSLVYKLLKSKHVPVRGLLKNVTKAREVLGCSKCDESEGIFLGDVTDASTLAAPMRGAASLVIAASAAPICDPYPKCHYPKGGLPVDVDWHGAKNQLTAFAEATAGKGSVVLISTMGTTEPEGPTDIFEHISFYKLNFEAELMASRLPYTIIKPCGLVNTAAGAKELLAGHDDTLSPQPAAVSRADVARVTVAALESIVVSTGLRFDLCSREGKPTTDDDLPAFIKSASYPWDAAAAAAGELVL